MSHHLIRTSSLLLHLTLLTHIEGSSQENGVETCRMAAGYELLTISFQTREIIEDGSISDRQLAEFMLLGKFKLGQIRSLHHSFSWIFYGHFRSQLEYDTFFKNYELNQQLYFDMAGIRTFEDTSKFHIMQLIHICVLVVSCTLRL